MDHKPDKLLICHWNARSLNQNKQSELKDFLATHNIDICLVSETYKMPKDFILGQIN